MPSIPDYFDEYQANKVDTTVEFMQARLDMLAESAPDWFKFEAGFRFVWDTSPSIYIGPGGHRDLSDFQPPSILFAFLYKGVRRRLREGHGRPRRGRLDGRARCI